MRSKRELGSASIEATISLVFFTFFMVSVLLFVNVSRAQMHLQTAADKAVKEITGYLYLYKLTGLYDLDLNIQKAGDKANKSINSALQSFDKVATGIEEVTSKINQTVNARDSKQLIENVKAAAKSGKEAGQTIRQESSTLKALFNEIRDDPIAYVKSLGALAASYGLNEAKNFLIGSLLARSLTLKYMGGEEAADALLRHYHVEDGAEGLDFTVSTVFDKNGISANPAEDVNIVIVYRMSVAPLMGDAFRQTFAVTASARGWLGGDTLIDRLKSPNPPSTASAPGEPEKQNQDGEEDADNSDTENEDTEDPDVEEEEKKPWNAKEARDRLEEEWAERYWSLGDVYMPLDKETQGAGELNTLMTVARPETLDLETTYLMIKMQYEKLNAFRSNDKIEATMMRDDGEELVHDFKMNGGEPLRLYIYMPPEYDYDNPIGAFSFDKLIYCKNRLAQEYGITDTEQFNREFMIMVRNDKEGEA